MKNALSVLTVIFILALCNRSFSQENKNAAPSQGAAVTDAAELETKATATEQAIKEKEEKADTVKEEMEKIKQEKDAIAKQAELKEEAAAVAKKELAVMKKEAAVTRDAELEKQARELAKQAKQLEKEAAIYKEKLEVAAAKADLAEKNLAASTLTIDSLKSQLSGIRYKKAALRSLPDKLFDSLVIIIVSLSLFFVVKYVIRLVEAFASRHKGQAREVALRVKTLGKMLYWLSAIGIVVTAVYVILETFGVSVAPLLAGAGILGLAFGFGGQYLTRDVINGFFILLEGQYRIDDVVKIGEFGGLVEDINLRITTLRDMEGRVIIIPNGEIKTVINFTKEYAHALFDMRVAYKENVDKVMEAIKEVGAGLRKDGHFGPLIMDDLEMLGVDDFTDSAVIIKFRIKTLPIRQWDVSREFRRRLKNKFDELGIEIPFQQLKIYRGDEEAAAKTSRKEK